PSEPALPRRRAWPLAAIALALALVAGGAVAAMVWLKKPATAPPADARPVVVATVPPDAAPSPDAAPVIDGDPWRSDETPSIPPTEPEEATPSKHRREPTMEEQMKLATAMAKCQQVIMGAMSDPIHAQEKLAACICKQKDKAAARIYLETLGDGDHEVIAICKKYGVVSP
ncbi:MAG: hypothetical protein ABI678_31540, partial [Kofleriaceae bacterium]